jgi:Arabinose-binding domain of AraC transcription regulator, N-term
MGSVGTPVIRRIVQVAQGPDRPEDLLASVGLSPEPGGSTWTGESVDAGAYYGLIERVAAPDDLGFPFRYGEALQADDLGALGLAMKTAPTVGDALHRLVRYVLVLSDTLEYQFVERSWGRVFALTGRTHHRRGAALANECPIAAVTSFLRQAVGTALTPREVAFRHAAPSTDRTGESLMGEESISRLRRRPDPKGRSKGARRTRS